MEMPTLNEFIQKEMAEGEVFEVKILNTGSVYVGFKKGIRSRSWASSLPRMNS